MYPHQKLTVPFGLATFQWAAQYPQAAGVQIQVEIVAVDFADNTSWALLPRHTGSEKYI